MCNCDFSDLTIYQAIDLNILILTILKFWMLNAKI